jgi:heparan-alpha-glucosaminide N-acetyltransferase
MAPASSTSSATAGVSDAPKFARSRVTSIDRLRGLVMFLMIFVNDLAGAPEKIVPPWLKHFHGASGMTFVDLVFPAFLFLVGMSIPFALGGRLERGEAPWKILGHVIIRTLSLLLIGIMMVNETPSAERMGWSGDYWCLWMYLSAILAFCVLTPGNKKIIDNSRLRIHRGIVTGLRAIGFGSLIYLALVFRDDRNHAILTLSPFSIQAEWFGILGLIGWAYLVGSIVFLIFRNNRTALLGCGALLLCLYPADKSGAFDKLWLSRYVGVGEMLGAHPSITVAGILLAVILLAPDMTSNRSRCRFTLWFVAGFAAAALLLHGLYGINKNEATPSWCLWACAVTAMVWLVFYLASENCATAPLIKPFAIAGQNVLLAYLISEMLPSLIGVLRLNDWYYGLAGPHLCDAVVRSAVCSILILLATAGLNRMGFRLKL